MHRDRSFPRVLFRLLQHTTRVPERLAHLWQTIVVHALAALVLTPWFEPGHSAATPHGLLLVSLVVWVLPWARPRILARAATLLVLAGTVLAITMTVVLCARTLLAT